MIPRIVHQFWTGGPCPFDLTSWDLPGWEHRVWSAEDLPDWFRPTPQWEDPAAFALPFNNPVERMQANVVRFELLGEEGGIWADCDMQLEAGLDRLLIGSCNLALFGRQIGTGFIAAEPHHPFIESCRATLRTLDRPVGVASMWAAQFAPTDEVTFLDPALVYPGPYWEDPDGPEPEVQVLRNLPRARSTHLHPPRP